MKKKIVGIAIIIAGLIFYKLLRLELVGASGAIVELKQYSIKIITAIIIVIGIYTVVNKNQQRLFKIYASVLSLILILLLVEFYFRFLNPQIIANDQDRFYEYHELFGWHFTPNAQGKTASPAEYTTQIKINSKGYRDEEYTLQKPAHKKRIVVLGDSMVSALQVPLSQVFTEQLEKKLENVDVINVGVPGYGPTQQLLQLKSDVLPLKPDVVIVLFSLATDFDDVLGTYDWNFGYHRPHATLNDETLKIENIPVPRKSSDPLLPKKNILPRSHLVQFIENILYARFNPKNLNVEYETRFFKKSPSEEVRTSQKLTQLIFKEMRNITATNSIQLLVVTGPSIVQVYHEKYWPQIAKMYALKEQEYDITIPNQLLRSIIQQLSIQYIDVLTELQKHANDNDLYFYKDRHWNVQGHTVVADSIFPVVTDLLASSSSNIKQ